MVQGLGWAQAHTGQSCAVQTLGLGPEWDGGCQAVWEGTPSGPARVLLVPSAENI